MSQLFPRGTRVFQRHDLPRIVDTIGHTEVPPQASLVLS
jgi:hypothetical protein